ncbi:hypothetical protein AB0L85_05140 [Streptomyces sp. NPDC052051]|uniref:hypothetical protein n=1 Tax=Streptomyces sp. NPDC052051 TaxID=3154649 RepID=UPI00342987E5
MGVQGAQGATGPAGPVNAPFTVEETFALPGNSSVTHEVTCPAGTRVTGGGVASALVGPDVAVVRTTPLDNGWLGTVHNGTIIPATFTVSALCIPVTA